MGHECEYLTQRGELGAELHHDSQLLKQQCCAPSSRTLAELFGKGSEMQALKAPRSIPDRFSSFLAGDDCWSYLSTLVAFSNQWETAS